MNGWWGLTRGLCAFEGLHTAYFEWSGFAPDIKLGSFVYLYHVIVCTWKILDFTTVKHGANE